MLQASIELELSPAQVWNSSDRLISGEIQLPLPRRCVTGTRIDCDSIGVLASARSADTNLMLRSLGEETKALGAPR